jgi:hypothetical protein
MTGLTSPWRRPRYVFGIDGVQALHLAMKCAAAVLGSARVDVVWLGETGDLGMPKFLPDVPRAEQDRLEKIVEREATKFWRRVVRDRKRGALDPRNPIDRERRLVDGRRLELPTSALRTRRSPS